MEELSKRLDRKIIYGKKIRCSICRSEDRIVSGVIGVCVSCIRSRVDHALDMSREAHSTIRAGYGLSSDPPRADKGIPCKICAHECIIPLGEKSYCGLRLNKAGRMVSLSNPKRALYHAYLDPQVTNCCNAWFCPAGTGEGYPKYTYCKGPEIGYYNLAIFFYGCNFDCLFCQNYSHKSFYTVSSKTDDELIDMTLKNSKVSCWCFFGGSPEPQLPFAINASRRILETLSNRRILRICFEWNGCGNPRLVKRAAEIALQSGGNIKFDLKCWNEDLSYALCGVSNRRAYENFEMVAKEFYDRRSSPPILAATTLLVPGYVDDIEVEGIAKFIADINPEIPYSLLVFHPDFYLVDLPVTSRSQVDLCYKAAKKYLRRVNIGNIGLIGFDVIKL